MDEEDIALIVGLGVLMILLFSLAWYMLDSIDN